MKSSWNRQSLFLLVRVKKKGKWGFVVPVPLWVLTHTLEAVALLASVVDKICPSWPKKFNHSQRHQTHSYFSAEAAIRALLILIREMRSYGRLRLVEVENKDHGVYIDFY